MEAFSYLEDIHGRCVLGGSHQQLKARSKAQVLFAGVTVLCDLILCKSCEDDWSSRVQVVWGASPLYTADCAVLVILMNLLDIRELVLHDLSDKQSI